MKTLLRIVDGDDPDGDNAETDNLSSKVMEVRTHSQPQSPPARLQSNIAPTLTRTRPNDKRLLRLYCLLNPYLACAFAGLLCSAARPLYKSVYHGINVRFQNGAESMLDGKRLDALMEVGEHNGTKDVVVVRYRLQRFDEPAILLLCREGSRKLHLTGY